MIMSYIGHAIIIAYDHVFVWLYRRLQILNGFLKYIFPAF